MFVEGGGRLCHGTMASPSLSLYHHAQIGRAGTSHAAGGFVVCFFTGQNARRAFAGI